MVSVVAPGKKFSQESYHELQTEKGLSRNMILSGESLQIHEWPQGLFKLHASLTRNFINKEFHPKLYGVDPKFYNLQVNNSWQSYSGASDPTVCINYQKTYMQFNSEHSAS